MGKTTHPTPEHRNAQVQGVCQTPLRGNGNPLICRRLCWGGVQKIPLANALWVPGSVFSGYFDVMIFTFPV